MLVLSRKLNEQIKIGDDITVTVIKLRNNQIRLGIEAPRDVRVLRGELESEPIDNDKKTSQPSSIAMPVESAVAQVTTSGMQENPQLCVVDGMQSAASMMEEERSVAEQPLSRISSRSAQPLGVFMGKMKVNGSRKIVEPLSEANLTTAT